ncbi:MAG TPA: AI-2E family transporter [Edaphobacter sp.]|uniref:AI-2E family transporter n=1 Tax=Edaphobacter sp. TaxID=1934404 RepID=UPI002CA8BE99|nr:AI-2E family transporter [Edaphobacter sp.]HUZ96119.1 AI-2E family transporter [Edaphobacter sp.]
MVTRSSASRELSRLLIIVVAVVAIAVLYLAKEVVVPLALAVLFSFLLAPVVTFLQRIRLPRILAISLVILAAGGIVGGGGWTVFTQLVDVTAHLPAYASNINEKLATLHSSKSTSFSRAQKEVELLSQKIGVLSSNTTPDQRHPSTKALGASPNRPVSVQEVGQTNGRLGTIHGVLGAMVSILLVIVFTFFMLMQREDLRNRFIRLTGHGHLNLMTQALDDASRRVSRYLSLQLLVNTCYGSIIFTALHFMGLPHAILWGALAGVLRFIPYIGAPIAGILPSAFSIAVFNGWTHTLVIMAIFFCMEVVTANFIEPHVYGRHTGLSSLAILVAAVFWTILWGPIGLILSVPLTVCVVIVGGHVPSLEFLTVLLGDQPVMRPEAQYYQRLLAGDQREASQVLDTYLKDKSLEDLYDSVLVPALSLSEQDRHGNVIDDATVGFIMQTTKDLVEELCLSSEDPKPSDAARKAMSNGNVHGTSEGIPTLRVLAPKKIACVPVRDDADEVIAIMLAQLLERAGHSAKMIHLGSVDGMLAEVSQAAPDLVCLSALPPYALSYARAAYKSLRAQQPQRKIIIGLWNYIGDPAKAAKDISGGAEDHICTSVAQVLLDASGNVTAALAHETVS